MERKIFNYIKNHPGTSSHEVAKILRIPEMNTFSTINRLLKEGYLQYASIRPMDEGCSDSLTYKVRREML